VIRKVDEVPGDIFEDKCGISWTFIELSCDGFVYGYMAYMIINREAQGHSENISITPKTFKQLVEDDWPEVVSLLKSEGVKRIYTIYEDNGKRDTWLKYVTSLGFGNHHTYCLCDMEI